MIIKRVLPFLFFIPFCTSLFGIENIPVWRKAQDIANGYFDKKTILITPSVQKEVMYLVKAGKGEEFYALIQKGLSQIELYSNKERRKEIKSIFYSDLKFLGQLAQEFCQKLALKEQLLAELSERIGMTTDQLALLFECSYCTLEFK